MRIELTEQEYSKLNADIPRSMQNAVIAARTMALIRIYFTKKYPGCSFEVPARSADLKVRHAAGIEEIEIKGTASTDMAWAQLRVSSNQSHELLKSGAPLYRVYSVYERHPEFVILHYPQDFDMVPEPRWYIKQRRNA